MNAPLPPAALARLDQLHEANVAEFEQLLAAPNMRERLELQGEALFCAHLTNSLEAIAEVSEMDVIDMAAHLAIAIARLLKSEGTPS